MSGNRIKVRFVGGSLDITEGDASTPSAEGIVEMQAYIADVGKRARNLEPVFQVWTKMLFAQEERIFDSEGIPGWPRLSDAYADWKRSVFGDLPILQRSGRLYESLTGLTPDTILRIAPRTMEFGTKVPYSLPLTEGTYSGHGVARPHVYMDEDVFTAMSAIAMEYVSNGGGVPA